MSLLGGEPHLFSKYASWKDVIDKSRRLPISNLKKEQGGKVVSADVKGDTGTYDVYIFRKHYPKDKSFTSWTCPCTWGDWSRNRQTKIERVCSHVLAVMLKLTQDSLPAVKKHDPAGFTHEDGIG